jgi:hypothetical protein
VAAQQDLVAESDAASAPYEHTGSIGALPSLTAQLRPPFALAVSFVISPSPFPHHSNSRFSIAVVVVVAAATAAIAAAVIAVDCSLHMPIPRR